MLSQPLVASTITPSAYFLVAHGSRDPRPQQALEQVVALVKQRLEREAIQIQRPVLVQGGTLEFHPLPLAGQLVEFAQLAAEQGYGRVQVLPLFLLSGNHVQIDLPEAVAEAQQQLQSHFSLVPIEITLLPHLGSHPRLVELLRQRLASTEASAVDQWIFLAHGSRRPEANLGITALAAQLQAIPAFWAVAPNLETVVTELVSAEAPTPGATRRIGIFPYFLFPGTLLDGMIQQVAELQARLEQARLKQTQLHAHHSHLELVLVPPLEPSSTLVELILGLLLGNYPARNPNLVAQA